MPLAKYEIDFGQDCFDDMVCIKLIYSGCRKAIEGNPCKGCHNPWLWPFDVGIDSEEVRKRLSGDLEEWVAFGLKIDGIVLLGGEPVDQNVEEVLGDIALIKKAIPYDISVMLYVGYDSPADLTDGGREIIKKVDYVKFGRFLQDLPPVPGSKLASANQRMFRVLEDGRLEVVDF